MDWICPGTLLSFWTKQADVLSMRHAGTGQWLLPSKKFNEWMTGKGGTLFCPGIHMILYTTALTMLLYANKV